MTLLWFLSFFNEVIVDHLLHLYFKSTDLMTSMQDFLRTKTQSNWHPVALDISKGRVRSSYYNLCQEALQILVSWPQFCGLELVISAYLGAFLHKKIIEYRPLKYRRYSILSKSIGIDESIDCEKV